jgi:hypothetical protein
MDQNQEVPIVTTEPIPSPMIEPVAPKRSKLPLIIAAVVLVVIVLVGWGAYKVYASPGSVWQRFTQKAIIPKVTTEDYSFAYVDNGKLSSSDSENPFSSFFTNIKFSANGAVYLNNTDLNNPELNMDMNYSAGSGNTSLSSSAKFVLKDQNLYINLGSNPIVNSMLNSLSPDKAVEWLKFDLKKAQELEKMNASTTTADFDYAKQAKIYQDISNKYILKIVGTGKFIDKQTLHDVAVYHYSNTVNKDQLVSMGDEFVDAMINQLQSQGAAKAEDVVDVKNVLYKVIKNLADRGQITTFETWVGVSDSQLHKIKFVSTAPSLVSLFSAAQNVDQGENKPTNSAAIADLVLSKMSFDAQFTLEEELYNFGKVTTVTPPANSFDVIEKLKKDKDNEQKMMMKDDKLNK